MPEQLNPWYMFTAHPPVFLVADALPAAAIAGVLILLFSLIKEPARHNFMAIFVAGAGGAYLNGGLGPWEFPFATLMLYVAYRGLKSYAFIGIGWLLHTSWDVVHHFYGTPIVPFAPKSSAGCAVCDTLLALWFFYQAPSAFEYFRDKLRDRRLAA